MTLMCGVAGLVRDVRGVLRGGAARLRRERFLLAARAVHEGVQGNVHTSHQRLNSLAKLSYSIRQGPSAYASGLHHNTFLLGLDFKDL